MKKIEKDIREKLEMVEKRRHFKDYKSYYNNFYGNSDRDLNNLLYYKDLYCTCTMNELTFSSSLLSSNDLKIFTKEEFEFILFDSNFRSTITNVVKNTNEDKYLRSIGYEPVSSYRGSDGTINTYIFVNPEYKPRVRKISK